MVVELAAAVELNPQLSQQHGNAMSAQFVLYILAAVAFIIGALDLPQFGTLRCISLGLGLLTLALLVPLG